MAIDFKTSMTKNQLLELAEENGLEVDESMTKNQIISVLDAFNVEGETDPEEDSEEETENMESEEDSEEETGDTEPEEDSEEETEDMESEEDSEKEAEDTEPEEYNMYVYTGPSLPRGQLKENAVFRGEKEDVKAYLKDTIEKYPQIERLIVPVHLLGAYQAKVKKPGNITHKYYNDIVSAIRGNKEV